jgi:hypothetical protein
MRRGEGCRQAMHLLAFAGCGGKAAGGTAAARRGGGRALGGPTPLRCSGSWPAPQLAPLAALALLRQGARVRCGCARVRARPEALRSSAPPMRAAAVPPAALQARECPPKEMALSAAAFVAQAGVGQGLGRICGVEQRRASGRACTHAHPHLTRAHCLSKASEASGASWGAGQKPEQRRAARAPARAAAYKPQALAHPRLSRHNVRTSTTTTRPTRSEVELAP